jgi:hypothetical protein
LLEAIVVRWAAANAAGRMSKLFHFIATPRCEQCNANLRSADGKRPLAATCFCG